MTFLKRKAKLLVNISNAIKPHPINLVRVIFQYASSPLFELAYNFFTFSERKATFLEFNNYNICLFARRRIVREN